MPDIRCGTHDMVHSSDAECPKCETTPASNHPVITFAEEELQKMEAYFKEQVSKFIPNLDTYKEEFEARLGPVISQIEKDLVDYVDGLKTAFALEAGKVRDEIIASIKQYANSLKTPPQST